MKKLKTLLLAIYDGKNKKYPLYTIREIEALYQTLANGEKYETINGTIADIALKYGLKVNTRGIGYAISK